MKRNRADILTDLSSATEFLNSSCRGIQSGRLAVRCDIVHSLLHQLEQPERGGEPEVEPSLQAAFNEIEAYRIALNEVSAKVNANVKQPAALTETVTTHDECARAAIAELAKRFDTPAPKPQPVCEHPAGRRSHVMFGGGGKVERCGACAALLYGGVWHTPQPPAAKPACEHPEKERGNKEYWANGKHVCVTTCSCGAVRLGNGEPGPAEWFLPEPPREKAEGGETEERS